MTEEEIILWSRLKNKQLEGFKFRRQYSIGYYIIDFYCLEMKLAIELDGGHHFEEDNQDYDRMRQSDVEQLGVRFLRFTNIEVRKNLSGVLEEIRRVLRGD